MDRQAIDEKEKMSHIERATGHVASIPLLESIETNGKILRQIFPIGSTVKGEIVFSITIERGNLTELFRRRNDRILVE